MAEEFMSFEEALSELGISEQELKKLVAEGKLRSFRDGAKIKFRKSDILKLFPKGEEEAPLEEPALQPAEEGKKKEPGDTLESIFGDAEDFDITPLEEDDLISDKEAVKTEAEAPPAKKKGAEAEEVESIIEEAAEEGAPTLKEEAAAPATERAEEIEEIEEIEEAGPEEELAPIEEIEEKGEELSAAEMKELGPQVRIVTKPKGVSPFATVVLIIATVFLIYTTFMVVNSFARPDASYSIFKPANDFINNTMAK
jgi:excisionase family DNA binding protein